MQYKRRNIFFSIFKIAALLFYLPFFLVQVFVNHDSISSNKNVGAFYTRSSSKNSGVLQNHIDKTTCKLSTIRLNKRFEPATITFCVPVSFEITVFIVSLKSFGNYLNPSLASFHLLTHTLRGPPAVA
jgi:hypothetical protein